MNIEIANRLVELRKKSGLSQEELAAKLGLSRQAVSKWERAEASPDTDNLICLAKLYGVSLDDILNTDESIDEIVEEQVKDEGADSSKKEGADASNVNDKGATSMHSNEKAENQQSSQTASAANSESSSDSQSKETIHDDNTKEGIHIDSSGIHFGDGGDKGSIDSNGIHVTSSDGSYVHIDRSGLHFKDKDGETCDNPKHHFKFRFDDKDERRSHRYKVANSIVTSVVLMLAAAGYVVLGTLYNDPLRPGIGWTSGWLLFLLVPLVSSFISALKEKRFCTFAFPVLVVGAYLLLGIVWGMWHPYWVIFFSIPIYYSIFGPVDHAIHESYYHHLCHGVHFDSDDDDDDDDTIDVDVK